MKLVGRRGKYVPKNTDEVRCHIHGTVTTWGALDEIQKLSVESGIDAVADMPCLLAPRNVPPTTDGCEPGN